MSGNLSITPKHGRAPGKTYGVNRSFIRTMVTAVLVLCITITCTTSALAGDDVDFYPGIKFGLQPEDRPEPIDNGDGSIAFPQHQSRWRLALPWINQAEEEYERKKNPNLGLTLAENLRREFAELIRRRQRTNVQEIPYEKYPEPYDLPLPENPYNDYGKLERGPGNYRNFDLRLPNHQKILEDVRPYPHEDDDFSFHDESEIDLDATEERTEQIERADEDKRTTEEASGRGALEEAKVVEDPTEFAYPPSDPRYFQNTPVLANNKPAPSNTFAKVAHRDAENDREDEEVQSTLKDDVYIQRNLDLPEQASAGNDPVEVVAVHAQSQDMTGALAIAVVAGISAAATVGLIAFGIGWYNLQKHAKNASDVDYPAYGVTGPNKDVSPSGDRRLAQSAQMYHYQHQKQQIIAMESRTAPSDRHGSVSEADSDEENEEGDYTVYECPGLAPTGEMEVKNPLFQDDPTPAQTPVTKVNNEGSQKK